MLILRCVHLGELFNSCQVHGSVGVVYPVRPLLSPRYKLTPGGGTTVTGASSPALESAPAVTPTAPSPQGPGCSRGGGCCPAQLGATQWQERLHCPMSSQPPPVPGERQILGCVPQSPSFLHRWNRASGPHTSFRAEPLLQPLRAAPGSCSGVQPCALQPFRELGALSPGRRCLLVSQGARGHPRPPGVLL